MVAFSLTAVQSSSAELAVEPDKDPKAELTRLEKRSDELAKDYRGEIVNLSEVKKDAKRATDRYEQLERDAEKVRGRVGELAAGSYMSQGLNGIPSMLAGDPQSAVDGMAAVEYLARNNGQRVQDVYASLSRAERAKKTALDKVAEVKSLLDDLEGERENVKKLLAKYRPETPTKPDSAPKGKSPLIGNYMTSRMRTVYLEIDAKFGPFPAIGCYRAGDPQDHGSGRACDFMESTGGSMPSAGALEHGDKVAQHVIDNAKRLGLKYVIWKQRIWDVRSGSGWRTMSDRGGITANHFDHPHVSVL